MKKIFEQHSKYEQVFRNRKFEELVEEIKNYKNIKNKTINICEHNCRNGKTIIIVLDSGLIEIHELLSKNCIYLCASIRKKKIFEKVKKELELLND
ncbi:MAG: hypothetical protein IJX99_05555 [Clostridia bacterium]|nr:hypothetical protein [Clostridia bacterium]